MRASLRYAALLGASLYLVATAAHGLASLQPPEIVTGCLLLAAVGAAWSGRRVVAAVVAAATIGTMSVQVCAFYRESAGTRFDWALIADLTLTRITLILTLAGLAFLSLARGDERPPLTWLVFPCVPLGRAAAGLLAARFDLQAGLHSQGQLSSLVQSTPGLVTLVLGIIALAALVTDTRPAIGVGVYFVLTQLAAVLPQAQDVHGGSFADGDWLRLPLGLLDNLNAAALTVGMVTLAVMAGFLYRRTRTAVRPGLPDSDSSLSWPALGR
jgi:hypothetical protein